MIKENRCYTKGPSMKPVSDKSPGKSGKCSPAKTKLKPKRAIRKSQKRKKTDDNEWEDYDTDNSANFQDMIQKKVDNAVENILEKVNSTLDKKLNEMVKSYENTIEDRISKIVHDQINHLKLKCENNVSEIAAQKIAINNTKSLAGTNKKDIAQNTATLAQVSRDMDNIKQEMMSQDKQSKVIEKQFNDSIFEIEKSLNFHSAEVDDLRKVVDELKVQTENETSSANQKHTQPIALTEAFLNKLQQEHEINLNLQAYSRRHNVLVEGVREHPNEDCIDIMADICSRVLGLHDFHRHIDKAHRYGPRRAAQPRAIIVRFLYHHDADIVLAKGEYARKAGLRITPNFPKEIQRENALLYKVHRAAQQQGQDTRLNANQLHYKGQVYTVQNVHTSGLNTEGVAERRNDHTVRFFGRFSKFSNFYPVNMPYQGFMFKSAEQLYHYRRAKMVNNERLAIEIALSPDPADCKRLAKTIESNAEHDLKIMREVIEMKFSKDQFKRELMNTKSAELIECNPHDRFWGAGVHLDERQPNNSSGKNYLGVILSDFRKKLANN